MQRQARGDEAGIDGRNILTEETWRNEIREWSRGKTRVQLARKWNRAMHRLGYDISTEGRR